ncbi:tetratricopeptide repeat protein [bacterium]|nr:tetratricopeptide repeat protein [bacterium]
MKNIAITVLLLLLFQSCGKGGGVWRASMDFGDRALKEGRFVDAEKSYLVALDEAEQFGEDDDRLTETLMTLANFHRNRNKFPRSKPYFERALELRQKKLGMNDTLVIEDRNNLVELYYILGDTAKVESLGTIASDISKEVLGVDNLELARLYRIMAKTCHEEGRFHQADSLYRSALTILEKQHVDDQDDYIDILSEIAILYHESGQYAEADSLYCLSLDLHENLVGSGSPDLVSTLTNLANLKNETGDFVAAESLYTRALKNNSHRRSRSYFTKISLLHSLAKTCVAQGKYKKARRHYKKALEYIDGSTGMHPELIEILDSYSDLLLKLNKNTEAKDLKQRSLRLKEKLNK